jgi:hypothetical protein
MDGWQGPLFPRMVMMMIISGILPFSAIYNELHYYIFASMWGTRSLAFSSSHSNGLTVFDTKYTVIPYYAEANGSTSCVPKHSPFFAAEYRRFVRYVVVYLHEEFREHLLFGTSVE